jgi:hypothetical protein
VEAQERKNALRRERAQKIAAVRLLALSLFAVALTRQWSYSL